MSPERMTEIKRMLAKTYPNPRSMIGGAREAAKELVDELDRLNVEREAERTDWLADVNARAETIDTLRAKAEELVQERDQAHELLAGEESLRVAQAEAERDAAQEQLRQVAADMHAAAGELRIPIPEPGTDAAKLLHANIMLSKYRIPRLDSDRDAALKEVARLRAQLDEMVGVRVQLSEHLSEALCEMNPKERQPSRSKERSK